MASPRVAATVAVFAGRLRRRRSEAHGATQHESEQLHAGLDDDSLELPVRRLPERCAQLCLRPAAGGGGLCLAPDLSRAGEPPRPRRSDTLTQLPAPQVWEEEEEEEHGEAAAAAPAAGGASPLGTEESLAAAGAAAASAAGVSVKAGITAMRFGKRLLERRAERRREAAREAEELPDLDDIGNPPAPLHTPDDRYGMIMSARSEDMTKFFVWCVCVQTSC